MYSLFERIQTGFRVCGIVAVKPKTVLGNSLLAAQQVSKVNSHFSSIFPENKRICITFCSYLRKSPLLLGRNCWRLGSFLFWLFSGRLFIATTRFEEMSVYEDFSKTPFVNNSTADLLPGRNGRETDTLSVQNIQDSQTS